MYHTCELFISKFKYLKKKRTKNNAHNKTVQYKQLFFAKFLQYYYYYTTTTTNNTRVLQKMYSIKPFLSGDLIF